MNSDISRIASLMEENIGHNLLIEQAENDIENMLKWADIYRKSGARGGSQAVRLAGTSLATLGSRARKAIVDFADGKVTAGQLWEALAELAGRADDLSDMASRIRKAYGENYKIMPEGDIEVASSDDEEMAMAEAVRLVEQVDG